jgi:hypothetical protein
LWTGGEELTATNTESILVGAPLAVGTPQPPPSAAPRILPLVIFVIGLILLLLLLFLPRMFRKK